MTTSQAAILAPVPPVGRYILFTLATDATPATLRESLARLKPLVDGEHTLLALGPQLVQALGAEVPGLREFPALQGPEVDVPSSPTAMLCKGLTRSRSVRYSLSPRSPIRDQATAFRVRSSEPLRPVSGGVLFTLLWLMFRLPHLRPQARAERPPQWWAPPGFCRPPRRRCRTT